jgi:hypothetical protein
MKRIQLGDTARHVVTGFEGVVVASVDYLQGCRQLCLQPRKLKENGEIAESHYFDEPYIDLVETGTVPMRDVVIQDNEISDRPKLRMAGPDKAPGRRSDYTPA